MRYARKGGDYSIVDGYFETTIKQAMYNQGKGKLESVAELVKMRNKERNERLGAFSRKKGKGKSGPNILDDFNQEQQNQGDLKKALKLLDGGKGGKGRFWFNLFANEAIFHFCTSSNQLKRQNGNCNFQAGENRLYEFDAPFMNRGRQIPRDCVENRGARHNGREPCWLLPDAGRAHPHGIGRPVAERVPQAGQRRDAVRGLLRLVCGWPMPFCTVAKYRKAGLSPLHQAIVNEDPSLCNYLLQHGADVNQR